MKNLSSRQIVGYYAVMAGMFFPFVITKILYYVSFASLFSSLKIPTDILALILNVVVVFLSVFIASKIIQVYFKSVSVQDILYPALLIVGIWRVVLFLLYFVSSADVMIGVFSYHIYLLISLVVFMGGFYISSKVFLGHK